MNRETRECAWVARAGLAVLVSILGICTLAGAANAHPLGNFTVNSYSGLTVEPSAIEVRLVVDTAEIPTLQAFADVNGAGVAPAEQNRYRTQQCDLLAAGARLSVGGSSAPLKVLDSTLSFPPGNAGLHTMRLTCDTRTADPVQTVGQSVTYLDTNATDRVGWHEITAVGDGVTLPRSDVPTTSPSQLLTAYPAELLSSPLNQREAKLDVATGTGVVSGQAAATINDPTTAMPRGVDRLTTAFTDLVASRHLTFGFALLAIGLAVLLGSAHAFAPGHGKTLMAAYLVGRRSSLRQAATIGMSVTVTHTVGVLVLGVVLSVVAASAPERVYPWLGLASGVMLVGIGATLLRNALLMRNRSLTAVAKAALAATETSSPNQVAHHLVAARHSTSQIDERSTVPATAAAREHETQHEQLHEPHTHSHDHHLDPEHSHDHHDQTHDHSHDAPDGVHSHGLFSHTHLPPAGSEKSGAKSLLAVGFAGGLVPSPSALVVLLGGIALGRAWFGVILVVAYGIGMALALVGTGFVLVKARDRLSRWAQTSTNSHRTSAVLLMTRALPTLTALILVGAGISVMIRSIITL